MSQLLDDVIKRLNSPDTESRHKVEAATQLRDNLDVFVNGPSYKIFLQKVMPMFINILNGPCVFQSNSNEQKLRNTILEIVHRFPIHPAPLEPFHEYANETIELMMRLVRTDNEENAVICVKVVSDIMRNQPKIGQNKVQDFLNLIQELFEQMERVVREQLDNEPATGAGAIPSTPSSAQTSIHQHQSPRPASPTATTTEFGVEQPTARPLLKGMQSFKVLSECPIIVVSIFQVYRNTVPTNVKAFVPLIKSVLCLQAKAQEQAHADAATRGEVFAGISPNIKNRAAFGEFITAQVKTMSFLAYLLRQYAQQLTDFLPTLPDIVVRLLKDCPREKSGARKELLVAIRHIINFNFRKIFLPKIDELLEERTLIGDGLTVHENMRPLAYSMLADLIHHVRDSLTPTQIRKTVEVYTRNLQDNFPGTSFQTMSAKLLLNMADCIAKLDNKVDARHYLIMILNAIGDKFAAMNRQYANAVKLSKAYAKQAEEQTPDTYLADKSQPPDWDEIDIFNAMPIKTSNPREKGADPVGDNKFLFKNLMNGLKNTFYQLRICNPPHVVEQANAPPHWVDVAYGFSPEDVQVIIKLFREGAYVFRYYEIESPVHESQYQSAVEYMANFYMNSSTKEEKDLLETFATVFHSIDPATFNEVFQQEIPHLYDMIFDHTGLLHIPQFFLASEATSPSFCGMLLRFLMEHIEDVGSADVRKASILLRLFKLAFMAVTLFAAQNEQVLLPHVVDIVTKSIEYSTKAEEPMNYFLLLRSLFRSIGGGKFEHLYKRILPLLEMLLDVLNNLLRAARKPQERDLYVELCLTVPARLSNLLPHLSFLMRPLVVALRAGSDLVGQGLRTLELCVDNLTADYLDPIMAPVMDELMTALFDHLKPAPYQHFHAHTTLRILGKLGGRNRKYLTDAVPLDYKPFIDDSPSFDLRLIGSKKDRAFPATIGIQLAISKLTETPKPTKNGSQKQFDGYYKEKAFHFLKAHLKLRIGYDNLPEDLPRLVRLQVQDLLARKTDADFSIFETSDRQRSVANKEEQDITLKRLIKAIMFASSLPDFKDEANAFLLNLCRHFAVIEVGRALVDCKRSASPFDVNAGEGPMCLDTRVLCDAILESLASEHPDVRSAAQRATQEVYNSAAIILGSSSHVFRLTFFHNLGSAFCHGCYEEEWFTKAGGSLGIKMLLTDVDLGDSWITMKQADCLKALLFVVKDMPQDLPEGTRRAAQDTLDILLARITKDLKKEDCLPLQPQRGQPAPKQPRMAHICNVLNQELSHMNRHVRETAKHCLGVIAKAANAEVWELLDSHRDRLLSQIYAKPLRALPFPVQIGYIDAVTYYMSLKTDFVKMDENLTRLLMESLALAEATDDSLATKAAEFRTQNYIVSLRVACIKILSTAMDFEDFMKPQQPNQPSKDRTRIVATFFKCLYLQQTPIIDAAYDALKTVLSQNNKLPKDLLQSGLRPVLASLQDAKRLSLQGLNNLARLLKLLTSYFKVEIGQRLLDHVKQLAESNLLQQLSFTFFEQNETMEVIAAVFNIFHLLPPAAESYKEQVIKDVLTLEDKLRRTNQSPFRKPVYKYLNRYSQEVWAFLLTKLCDIKFGRFFTQVLLAADSGPFREVATANIELLVQTCNDVMTATEDTQLKATATINVINIIDALCQLDSTAWMSKTQVLTWLKNVGSDLEIKLRANEIQGRLRLAAHQAVDNVTTIGTKFLEKNPEDLELLFSLTDAVTHGHLRQTHSLFSYIYKNIIENDSIEYWRTIILRCLEIYAGKTAAQKTKIFLLHNIVNPIVAMDVMRHWQEPENRPNRLIDRTVIDSISTKIWKASLADPQDDLVRPGIDHTRMEVLQLSAMLIKYHNAIIQDARKDIIKFGWTYIKLDDALNKHAAYVVLCYFIANYDTPSKIVTQVYLSLLKNNQNEGRTLVTQALELMAPVLPRRCSPVQPADPRNAVWSVGPRRILAEEGQNVQQMTSIFQFLVRHPDLFYETRDKFAVLIIQCLRKVANPPNPSYESRRLALNMMWLIWEWEKRRVTGKETSPSRTSSLSPASRKRKLEDISNTSPPAVRQASSGEKTEYQINASIRQKMVKYLVEFIAQLNERYEVPSSKSKENGHPSPMPADLNKKAMKLLYNLLQPEYWADLDVDLFPNVTDVVLASDKTTQILNADPENKERYDEKFITNIVNTLQVVRIILNSKTDEWILKNVAQIQKILEKCLKSENPELQDCLHISDPKYDDGRHIRATIKRVLDAVPATTSEDVPMEDADGEGEPEAPNSEFITFLSNTATESMASANYVSGINILWSLGNCRPSVIDPHIPAIMKSLQSKLARDHVSHYTALSQEGNMPIRAPDQTAPVKMDEYDLEVQTGLMLKAIDVTAKRMEKLGDNRRPFLSVLATLVEKSLHNPLCEKILEMVESWIFRSEGTWPTLKEKTAVLHKMLTFEHRADPTMLTKYLDLVLRIYEDPKITRTELTVRMEHAFLIGTRAQDVGMRNRFMALLDKSLSKTASARLLYVINTQNWDTLGETFWLAQASQLLLGSVDAHTIIHLHNEDFRTLSASRVFGNYARDTRQPTLMADDKYDAFMSSHRRFMSELGDVRVRDIVDPLTQLQHVDSFLAKELWETLFPMYWSATIREEREELKRGLVMLLTKDYHQRQLDRRPNVIQTLLKGAAKARPPCRIPPHVLKYAALTFGSWYTALVQLEDVAINHEASDSDKVRESNLNALVELYSSLKEDDFFYGAWRRRCEFIETNSALSYEQNGMWDKAQRMYESAQVKARTGALPFSQDEYTLWEDHWVLCAQKLQQWDILQDFSKHEHIQDLLLECAWRNQDMWSNAENKEHIDGMIKGLMDAPTPRRSFFQAFMSLRKLHDGQETQQDFQRCVDEAIQLSIRKWHQLPKQPTHAHIPLLQNFQQLVELHDASIICSSLASTTQQNLDVKSSELKLLLSGWRERLPNVWDDITAWQDLVNWRQHIFGMINQKYLTLLPQPNQNAGASSFAYRGYHETAWIINRFAHVARKHNLPDVCINQLGRIYTLPNIEIQEAFLKLREQAKCHYQNPKELTSGLEVINNTNLNYFSPSQKAEFYTLKGMFLEKLSQKDDADNAFGTALFFDISAAKAWAEWGYFNDRKFKDQPTDLNAGRQALTCYLQAAGGYKNAKSRKLIARILWLLSMDDANGTISAGFDDFKGDTPTWYWITFIPQLLTGLSHKEATRVHSILIKIARSYPQALYFQLRTNREDMQVIRKNHEAKKAKAQQATASKAAVSPMQQRSEASGTPKPEPGAGSRPSTANGTTTTTTTTTTTNNNNNNANPVKPEGGDAPGAMPSAAPAAPTPTSAPAPAPAPAPSATPGPPAAANAAATPAAPPESQPAVPEAGQKKFPWELTEEIMSQLKTAFPLLALSMETMVDQISKHFKCPPDEDAYRLIVALLNDGLAYVSRAPTSYARGTKLPQATETNITRFAETILPAHIRKTFEADFVIVKPTMYEYIHKLRKWRDKFEEKLDRRNAHVSLENFTAFLNEFKYQKFDEVEVPGQYLQLKDKNQDFIRVERFIPTVDLVRTIGASHRRLKIRGHDGSIHPFAVQHPAARHCRREERIVQLFRQLNQRLSRKKESRRRDLQFTLPLMVPLAPHIRIVQEDTSYITLQGVFEDHCRRRGLSKDEPVLFIMDKLRALGESNKQKTNEQSASARLEILNAIQDKWVPRTVALDFFQRTYADYADFWLFKRRFSYQLAALTFMTYVLYIDKRYPQKIHISRSTGNIWSSELLSSMGGQKPFFSALEHVPFRLTPNLQTLMGPLATEGVFSCSIMAIARCLTEPEFQLEHALTLFVRDEVMFWFTSSHRMAHINEGQLRDTVQTNCELVVKRAMALAATDPEAKVPANQTVIDLISKAVNPVSLAMMDALWQAYL
ncbi:hypothetical protein BD289DRAFT_398006 [Coniella lustricola]|uniref:Non-specific serine/threonine protein kinase n=1 Tax=Coniella lustricola TaxID=2025994 RepID=A0A2T2ZV01_9PEZI|nr:hypothetical protein BD289DRAFT_398006 [Coniella lustricola]